jgi:hypothetical protein
VSATQPAQKRTGLADKPADKKPQTVRDSASSDDQCVVNGCTDNADVDHAVIPDLCAAHRASRRGDSLHLQRKATDRE